MRLETPRSSPMFRIYWLILPAIAVFGAMAILPPASSTAQSGDIRVNIDSPGGSATVTNGRSIDITGWAVDADAALGTGIATVEISVDSPNGGVSDHIIADYGTARPDV